MALAAEFHKEDIKAAIRKRGISLKTLSEKSGLADSTCAASFFKPIPKANRAIAKQLGISVNKLWPEWYDKNGKRIRKKRASSTSKSKRGKS